ncbi:MAG: putative transporter, ATPase and permease component [Candidatus Midichloriaceae bacterium]|jgi:ATP-binding cassette subfamily B protein|nr:putative transporter, ATPase and permease component [Candidatus Midichloriaceae bacterium]
MLKFSTTLAGFLWFFIRKNFWAFFFIQFFCLAWTLDNIAWPQVIRMIISNIEEYHGPRELIWDQISGVVMLGALMWIIIDVSFRIQGVLSARIFPKFEANIRMKMFEYVSSQTHSYFSSNYSGALSNKINDMPKSAHSMMMLLMTMFIPVLVTAIIMTIMFAQLYPMFGMVIFIWICLHLGICLKTSRRCQDLSDVHAESISKLVGRIVDSFLNSGVVRLFARQNYEIQLAHILQNEERQKYETALMYIEKVKVLLGITAFLFVGVFMTSLQIHAYKIGVINLGDLIFIFQGTVNITMITWWAGLELPRFFQEIGVCQQALSVMKDPIQIVDAPDAKELVVKSPSIVFENVSFHYERNSNIFENKSVTIKPGEKVGLVGFSGSGKTTFVNLILRYFEISGGRILIDGQDISKVTQNSLRSQIVMIPQEPMLFHRSLMDNIRYGNLNATDEEVMEAARNAHCDEFIQKLKDKYHTTAGERGQKISGGQRQRIAIARAMLKDAPILIMDEATSALDSVTERYIQEAIDKMAKNRTTLIIAHRLSTLANMDRILVFKDGYIVEDGTHEELYKLAGHYKKLWDMQNNGFLPEDVGEEDVEETNEEGYPNIHIIE